MNCPGIAPMIVAKSNLFLFQFFGLQTATLQHPNRLRMDEYRTLGGCFSDDVFYVDQKYPQKRETGSRDGTYELSTPFATLPTNPNNVNNNNSNNFSTNVIMTNEINPRFATMSSPKLFHSSSCSKQQSQPVLVATLRPSEGSPRNTDRGQPTAYLISPNSLHRHGHHFSGDMQNPTFYSSTETYQTLNPSTFSKSSPRCVGSRGAVKFQKDSMEPKVTFNLEMIPMGGGGEGLGMDDADEESRKLYSPMNDSATTPTCVESEVGEDEDAEKFNSRLTNLVYGKQSHHSSFV